MIRFAITMQPFQLMNDKEEWEEFENEELVVIKPGRWHVLVSKYLGGYVHKIRKSKFDIFFEILE